MFKTSRQQQRFLLLIAFIVIGYAASHFDAEKSIPLPTASSVQTAFEQQLSDVQLEVAGSIVKQLPDDDEGTRHQKFIVKTISGLTLLIAHNLDIAPRVKNLRLGDNIWLYGEYEWSQKGGVLHWTHHDPNGHHVGGWIDYQGKRYQ
ncbi:MAG: hypothetical protein ACI9QV_000041 [Methylophagaceae bacterium]|jgi:hypothetical protein